MIKKIHFPLHAGTCVLFFASIFSYPYLNWMENLFLFVLACSYGIHRLFKREVFGSRNYFLIFLLIFLLSQFYIDNFQPQNIRWWFTSISGWLTLLMGFLGFVSLVSYKKIGGDSPQVQDSNQTFHDLIEKAIPGTLVVSLAMFFLFVLNIDEISPQAKLIPDYSIYIIIASGFVLFYSLNLSLKYLSSRKLDIFLKPVTLGVLIFLAGIGATKIYMVYTASQNALRSGSDEKLWQDLLELNKTPKVKSIDIKAMNELGKINMVKGNFKEAANYYKRILAGQAFNFEANWGLAEVAYKQKEWGKAQEAYKNAIYLRPKETDLYSPYIHSYIKDKKIDKAMELISSLKETHPISLSNAEDYLILGGAFLRKKNLQAASTYLQKGKEAMPRNYEAHFLLGRVYLESGKYAEACEAFEKTLQLNPNFEEGYYHLGIGYEHINQNLKAIEAFERVILIDHKNMKSFYHLKRLYAMVGLKEKAFKIDNLMEKVATKVIEVADWGGMSGENVYQNGDMYWAGTLSTPVFLREGNAKFILQAQGTPARGKWPHMIVKLDNEIVDEVDVTSEKLKDYEFKKTAKAGKYNLNVSFTNDEVALDKNQKIAEDRNLFVRKCWIVYE